MHQTATTVLALWEQVAHTLCLAGQINNCSFGADWQYLDSSLHHKYTKLPNFNLLFEVQSTRLYQGHSFASKPNYTSKWFLLGFYCLHAQGHFSWKVVWYQKELAWQSLQRWTSQMVDLFCSFRGVLYKPHDWSHPCQCKRIIDRAVAAAKGRI